MVLNSVRPRKLDIRLPGKGNSNSYGARPVHQIISMIEWIRTSRLSIKNSVALPQTFFFAGADPDGLVELNSVRPRKVDIRLPG